MLGRTRTWLTILTLSSLPFLAIAKQTSLNEVLAMAEAPEGVVIEIVTSDNAGLGWALPRAQAYVRQLRRRFSGLPIAIVTHGREQFALTTKQQKIQQAEHKVVRSLLQDDKVQVHVCGTYAGWRGLSEEDFPDYVDVAAAGPAQVNDYIAMGYLAIVIRTE